MANLSIATISTTASGDSGRGGCLGAAIIGGGGGGGAAAASDHVVLETLRLGFSACSTCCTRN